MKKGDTKRQKTEKGTEPKDDTVKKIQHIFNGNPRSKGERKQDRLNP